MNKRELLVSEKMAIAGAERIQALIEEISNHKAQHKVRVARARRWNWLRRRRLFAAFLRSLSPW